MRKLSFGVWLAAACSGQSTLDLRNYDRACGNANDCVLVSIDACCPCDEYAINKSAQAQYMADFTAAKNNCSGASCPNVSCPAAVPGCLEDLCVASAPPPGDAGGD